MAYGCKMGVLDPIERLVFVMRQSPDWKSLSSDYEAGFAIDSRRYKPPGYIQNFPDNIETCISIWNGSFPVNFFRCRQKLKEIAIRLLSKVKNSVLLSATDIPMIPSLMGNENFLLFFHDDDDWFSPDTFERLKAVDVDDGIVVFPLVRFYTDTFTFVRRSETAALTVGPAKQFDFRYQTNNYAISRKVALTKDLYRLRDHVEASCYANDEVLFDRYFDLLISATNKTPCSASRLQWLLKDRENFRSSISEYIDGLRGISIPSEVCWCVSALKETIELFELVLAGNPLKDRKAEA